MLQAPVIDIAALLFLVLPLFVIVMVYWCAKPYVVGESRPTSRARGTGSPPDGKGIRPLFYASDVPHSVESSGVRGAYGIPCEGQERRQENRDSPEI